MHRWSIILAGGDGTRLDPLTSRLYSDGRPKQFCVLDGGTRTMVEQTLDRSRLIAPMRRTIVSLCRHQLQWLDLLGDDREFETSVQPSNRGTGPAVLLAALAIGRREREATVALFPSDHYVSDDLRLAAYVHQGAVWVEHHREDIVVLGAAPTSPESEYGWLLPDAKRRIENAPTPARLVEKPGRAQAERLLHADALWSTSLILARVSTLLELIRDQAAGWWNALLMATVAGDAVLEDAYRTLEPLDLSTHVLSRAAGRLRMLPVNNVAWSDWGTESRVRETLSDLPDVGANIPLLAEG